MRRSVVEQVGKREWVMWFTPLPIPLFRRNIMKKILTAAVVAALGLSFGASAFAQSTSGGLTRAEVRAQLIQAEADGLVSTNTQDYPPSAATIQRNKAIWAAAHPESVVTTAGNPDTAQN
jgi:hypothetical protein